MNGRHCPGGHPGVSVIVGLMRGFVSRAFAVGWFVAYFAAQWLAPDVAPHIPVASPARPSTTQRLCCGLHCALLVWAVGSRLVRLLIPATPLSVPDVCLARVFGGLRGVVCAGHRNRDQPHTPHEIASVAASQGAQWLQRRDRLRPVLPPNFCNTCRPSARSLNSKDLPCAASSASSPRAPSIN